MSTSDTKQCPSCKSQALDLLKIDTGMRVALQSVDYQDEIHSSVCSDCYQTLSSLVSQGAKLRAQKIAKEENKKIIWRRRIDIMKKAREEMAQKNYTASAVLYEKYMQSLSSGFEVLPNQLVPSLFNGPNFKKEMVLVAYAYLDLFRIYDQSAPKSQKFLDTKNQLQLFANNPAVRSGILRKLKKYKSSAKTPDAVDAIIKILDKSSGSRCFIATAAFENPMAREVQMLCQFRDQILVKTKLGRIFVNFYYKTSPSIAEILDQSSTLKYVTRFILRAVASSLNFIFNLKS